MFDENIFGKRVSILRSSSPLTLQQLGEKIGLTKAAVGNLEHGRKKPSIDIACALAEYFEVPLDFLVGRGAYNNWEELMLHRTALETIMAQFVDMPHDDIQNICLPDFIALFGAMFRKVTYDPDTNTMEAFPLFPPLRN